MSVESKTNAQVMTRVTVIGAVVDGLLGLSKIGVGFVSQSHALVADGVHSLSDLGTDVLVILAAKWSQLNTGNYQVTLFEQQTPLKGVLVKAFRHSDRQVVAEAYTDQDGQVNLNLPTADRYLFSGVVIRPDTDPNYDWISHWPSLTIEVVN
mgnify:CR=1 FL=1